HAWQDCLCLRVSEPAIKFEDARSVGADHQARIKQAAERNLLFLQTAQQRSHDLLVKLIFQCSAPIICRAKRSHSARVGSGIAIQCPLVVARRLKQPIIRAIDKGVQRTFCSTQEFLDEDAATRFAKTVLIHHLINYRPRCGKITCNDHALTESKPVCFYNNWKSRSLAKPKRVIAPFKCPRVCSWNPLLAHQFLRKNL